MSQSKVPTIIFFIFCIISFSIDALAQREPVLKQIDVPHDYYFREMYLPQFTTGPSAVAWSPDGEEVVYSMSGTLWRQRVDETSATQLTSGGYDYQPDWSSDGSQIVFARYTGNAVELQLLELATGKTITLTNDGHVNVDPRFSPDGSQVAYVSTKDTGHFRIWIGTLTNGKLTSIPLSPERETKIPRYYYSQWDHQLSPCWSPDGQSLIFISNPDNIYGTGSIYKAEINNSEKLTLLVKEETAWRTKPDWSPDGQRIIYASYLGRQWHQLWISTTDQQGNAYPMTYGDFDNTNPRWSPDANRIAYISNKNGNTSLWIQNVLGGKTYELPIQQRVYHQPVATLTLSIVNEAGEQTPARVSIIGSDGRSYAPYDAWIHSDDAFDRSKQQYETHYFHSTGLSTIELPPGKAEVTIWHGLENKIHKQSINVSDKTTVARIKLHPLSFPSSWKTWVSGDVHVHMNYGGHYRNRPSQMIAQAEAEDLDLVFNTIVNKEQRIPDMEYFSVETDRASNTKVTLMHSQEHHTSYWGHMGLLGLKDYYLIPGYSTYPQTAIASAHPSNSIVADLAREQGAVVGYVHPFYEVPNPATEEIHNALPVDVALGKIDYYETVGFSYHKPSAEVWHRLLNCGFRVSAAGGTDAMANYASLRGPVGVDRTYVQTRGTATDSNQLVSDWLDGLKKGKTLATNSAILGFEINQSGPGSEIQVKDKKIKVNYKGFMRSVIPMDH
ncbi:MAG TPA: CehA/McbA family metallohydrolase, partial [Cyclobacteriaceae bacterium]